MSINAFLPLGNTVAFTANVAAPTAVQATAVGLGANQYEVFNAGNVTVFLGFGANATVANSQSTVVTTTGPGYPLLAGTDKIISATPNAFFTGITASGTATIYVTPGQGL